MSAFFALSKTLQYEQSTNVFGRSSSRCSSMEVENVVKSSTNGLHLLCDNIIFSDADCTKDGANFSPIKIPMEMKRRPRVMRQRFSRAESSSTLNW